MDWRSVRADSIDWEVNPISKRAGGYIEMMCNKTYYHPNKYHRSCGDWHDLTLGCIADLGVRHWLRCQNIGPLGVDVIKWVIDEAAQGRVAYRATKGRAADAYEPCTPTRAEAVSGEREAE